MQMEEKRELQSGQEKEADGFNKDRQRGRRGGDLLMEEKWGDKDEHRRRRRRGADGEGRTRRDADGGE